MTEDCFLKIQIEHWIIEAELNQVKNSKDFAQFTQERQELRERIFNYIKKRDKNDY